MNVLAIDTSTEIASLALKVGDDVISVEQNSQKTHARHVLSMIDRLLTDAGTAVHQLDTIVFGQGPGSFTGLRIACSIAKGLAYPHDIGMIPVSTLAAIASETRKGLNNEDAVVLAIIDARMQEVYWRIDNPLLTDTQDNVSAAPALPTHEDLPLVLAGVGWENYYEDMPRKIKEQIYARKVVYPKASAMIDLAEKNGQRISILEAAPVYIRNKVTQGNSRG